MKNEYIIISKTDIQKRIEELEEKLLILEVQYKECHKKGNIAYTQVLLKERYPNWKESKLLCLNEIALLKQIQSQSIPLIPEIEKAFDAGSERDEYGYGNANNKQDYISNLKLDI